MGFYRNIFDDHKGDDEKLTGSLLDLCDTVDDPHFLCAAVIDMMLQNHCFETLKQYNELKPSATLEQSLEAIQASGLKEISQIVLVLVQCIENKTPFSADDYTSQESYNKRQHYINLIKSQIHDLNN